MYIQLLKTTRKKYANIIKETFEADNIKVTVFNADKSDKAQILGSIQEADAVFIGSSTKYADMIGNLEEILIEMKEMNLEGKIAAAFGSYGWSGEAIEVVQDYLNETNMRVQSTSNVIKSTGMTHVEFPIRIRFSPKSEEKTQQIKHATTFVTDLLLSSI